MTDVALVTGASTGIGNSTALHLARNGYHVFATMRNPSAGQELDQIANDEKLSLDVLALDVNDEQSAQACIDEAVSRSGRIDVLVNNAGVGSSQDPKPLAEFDDDFWDLTFAVNVTAPYLLTKCTLPSMVEAGWGRIVNIASINAKLPALHGAAYTASKHAIAGLTKATAKEVGDRGVTANAVCPGVTATLMNDKRLEYDAERTGQSFAQLEENASPLGRRLIPEEVAALAVFLCGDSASAINGQSFNVCGGVCFN